MTNFYVTKFKDLLAAEMDFKPVDMADLEFIKQIRGDLLERIRA